MTGAFLETRRDRRRHARTRRVAAETIGLTINYLRSGRALDSFARVSIVKRAGAS